MTYAPTKLDHAVYAHIGEYGRCNTRQLRDAGLSGNGTMLAKVVKRLTDAGYLLRHRPVLTTFGGGEPCTYTATGKPMPVWVSQTGPKGGPRMPKDDPWQRTIEHKRGDVPAELWARVTLSGLVQQVMGE